MTGIAAAICLGFSSCSKFDFTPITHGEEVYESYETAFVNKFGEPAPEQTWGFGTSTSTRAALTRSILASYNFPSDASSDNFCLKCQRVLRSTLMENPSAMWMVPYLVQELNLMVYG